MIIPSTRDPMSVRSQCWPCCTELRISPERNDRFRLVSGLDMASSLSIRLVWDRRLWLCLLEISSQAFSDICCRTLTLLSCLTQNWSIAEFIYVALAQFICLLFLCPVSERIAHTPFS
ncbi:hypothetical protein P170DRAFT_133337 [Aspergillus steynii IBT 23096]|uniref:Uncharacterized protein n=1 Tax=Aspergillus steynii IBT 23096 TaxID=1392250 RepID=A0A2I2GAH7_9EURO|nr:uncharacterized protein P170DRAFT_133337 [Aspergillus steynii IBT 23096]PLB49886.1 hypothetical protein P170DRAFT_133337 [Aspergillus steynii IBT 23096]